MNELQAGDKVKYHTGDEKWKNGAIHGVRKVDDVDGTPRILAYLIDTGGDERLDVYQHNLKDLARHKEFKKHLDRGAVPQIAAVKAIEATGKIPDEIIETIVRQPKQVDVGPEWVQPR